MVIRTLGPQFVLKNRRPPQEPDRIHRPHESRTHLLRKVGTGNNPPGDEEGTPADHSIPEDLGRFAAFILSPTRFVVTYRLSRDNAFTTFLMDFEPAHSSCSPSGLLADRRPNVSQDGTPLASSRKELRRGCSICPEGCPRQRPSEHSIRPHDPVAHVRFYQRCRHTPHVLLVYQDAQELPARVRLPSCRPRHR